jgi:ubiquinone/menaquinone biosynthesis C-methylase UbiE
MSSRKREEQEFHDRLRTEAFEQRWTPGAEARTEADPRWANFKYYAVERRSLDHARAWLRREVAGRTVLDYGCGNGEESLLVARHGAARVVGIDISEVSIKNCRLRADREGLTRTVDFRVNDGEALEFGDHTFDVAMEYGVLHHVDLEAGMRELARVLKPNGRMICTEALGHNPIIQAYRRRTPDLRTQWEVEHILRKEAFATMGRYFRRIEPRFFHLATLAAVPFRKSAIFRPLLGLLEAADAVLLRTPGLKWHAWITVFVLSEPVGK